MDGKDLIRSNLDEIYEKSNVTFYFDFNTGNESVIVGSNSPLSLIFCNFHTPVKSWSLGHFMRSNPRAVGTSFGLMPRGMVTLGID